jgi:hypothetical protein
MNPRASRSSPAPAPSSTRTLTTASSSIWLADDGIVHIRALANRQQGLKDAIENVSGVARIAGGVKRPLLVHFQMAAPQTPECRAYYVSEEAARAVVAVAIVTSSVLGRVIGNLMLGMNDHKIALKLFDTEPEAQKWLEARWGLLQPPRAAQR